MKPRRYRVEEINKDRLGLFAAEDPLKGEVGFNVQEVAVIRIMKGTAGLPLKQRALSARTPPVRKQNNFKLLILSTIDGGD